MTTSFKQESNLTELYLISLTIEKIESEFLNCQADSVKILDCYNIDITPRVWDLFRTLSSLEKLTLDQCRFAPEIYLNFPHLKKLKLRFVCKDFLNLLNLRIIFPNMTEKLMFEDKPLFRLL
jgi:hypothetical protein